MDKRTDKGIGITLVSFFLLTLVSAILHFIGFSEDILMASRWMALGSLLIYGIQKRNLTAWIFISMLLGIEIGYDFPDVGLELKILSEIFLRLIKCIVAPLIFSTLVVGIAGHSNMKQVGRIGLKSLIYFEIVTTFALIIGLLAINISQAGVGATIPQNVDKSILAKAQQMAEDKSAAEIILHTFPENIAKSVANGDVLQVVVFTIIFAIGTAMASEQHRKRIISFNESLAEVMFKFTHVVMYFAPLGVGGAIAATIAANGLGIFVNLIALLGTLYIALAVFILCVFIPIMLLFRIPVMEFFKAVSEPVSIAFASASSESALPKALTAMEKFGVPRKIVSFVLPTGYSFNLDGTTLYLSLAAVFVAQVANVPMEPAQQAIMVLTLMLTSKGVAGVPRASLVILTGAVASFGLPSEPLLIIIGIDALMDMGRTAVNVMGNCLASAVIARWEGEFRTEEPEVTV